jgi:hypothetical protein
MVRVQGEAFFGMLYIATFTRPERPDPAGDSHEHDPLIPETLQDATRRSVLPQSRFLATARCADVSFAPAKGSGRLAGR